MEEIRSLRDAPRVGDGFWVVSTNQSFTISLLQVPSYWLLSLEMGLKQILVYTKYELDHHCGCLNKSGSHSLICLKTWHSTDGTVQKD